MLVACTAAARMLFRKDDRIWAALVMPALVAALAATLSRNAWVGACAGIGLLFLIRDFRLVALLPVVAAVFIAVAPAQMTDRLYSYVPHQHLRHDSATTEASLLSNRDRLAMIRSGLRIIKDDPLTGVGPDMVIKVYPHYRDPRRGQAAQSAPPQRAAADRRRARAARRWRCGCGSSFALLARLRPAAQDDGHARRSRRLRWPASSRCWPRACSSTTSATPSS